MSDNIPYSKIHIFSTLRVRADPGAGPFVYLGDNAESFRRTCLRSLSLLSSLIVHPMHQGQPISSYQVLSGVLLHTVDALLTLLCAQVKVFDSIQSMLRPSLPRLLLINIHQLIPD